MKLEIQTGTPDADLIEQIVEFDEHHMKPVMAAAGLDFSAERRREGVKNTSSIFIAALNAGKLAGYLEFGRSWNDADLIYFSSIQIDKKYRHSKIILRLIDEFRKLVEPEDFSGFESSVQKNNLPAVKLHRKIGFRFEEKPANPASWRLSAERRLLEESPVILLIDRWRRKKRR